MANDTADTADRSIARGAARALSYIALGFGALCIGLLGLLLLIAVTLGGNPELLVVAALFVLGTIFGGGGYLTRRYLLN